MSKWFNVNEKMPIVYETGDWDGKRSDFVLVECRNQTFDVGRVYEGTIDGSYFCDFFDKDDNNIQDIVRWKYIN